MVCTLMPGLFGIFFLDILLGRQVYAGADSERATGCQNGSGEGQVRVARSHEHHGDGGRADAGARARNQVRCPYFGYP